jgi:hypothetical protein
LKNPLSAWSRNSSAKTSYWGSRPTVPSTPAIPFNALNPAARLPAPMSAPQAKSGFLGQHLARAVLSTSVPSSGSLLPEATLRKRQILPGVRVDVWLPLDSKPTDVDYRAAAGPRLATQDHWAGRPPAASPSWPALISSAGTGGLSGQRRRGDATAQLAVGCRRARLCSCVARAVRSCR